MGNILKRFVAVSVLLILGACSAPVINKEQADGLKNIGIVSLLPDHVAYHKIGITVFNNEYSSKPVGDALNRSAQNSVVAEVKKYPNKSVQVLEVDSKELAKRYRAGSLVMSYNVERLRNDLMGLAKQNKLDAIVVVSERFDSENGVGGVRVFLAAGFGDIRAASIQAGMTVSIVAADGSILGINNSGGRYGIYRAISRPNGAWSYRLDDNLDDATHQHVSKHIQTAVAEDVASSLRQVGF